MIKKGLPVKETLGRKKGCKHKEVQSREYRVFQKYGREQDDENVSSDMKGEKHNSVRKGDKATTQQYILIACFDIMENKCVQILARTAREIIVLVIITLYTFQNDNSGCDVEIKLQDASWKIMKVV